MQPVEKMKKEGKILKKEIRDKVLASVAAGVGVVVSLAWNEAIKALLEYVFPLKQDTILAKFVYAFLITLILVFVSVFIVQWFSRNTEEKQ